VAAVRPQVVHLGGDVSDEPDPGAARREHRRRDAEGRLTKITLNRLKDKLGTRKVPTAELMLEGTPATPVMGLQHGIRNIVPMLQVTRTWNSITAVSFMRRGVALAQDYARRREAFGASLSQKPLHFDTIATLQAEAEAGFHLAFLLTELLGLDEVGEINEEDAALLRLLTSVVKLTTARQTVSVCCEVLEAFGGAGYVEDTGLPMLLRDAQVLPIWEGTTNVLSLDTLRALSEGAGLEALRAKIFRCTKGVSDVGLIGAGERARHAVCHAIRWLEASYAAGNGTIEAGARRFALTLGRALSLALLVDHADWSMAHEKDGRARAAAIRFSLSQIDHVVDMFDDARISSLDATKALANDEPIPLS